MKNVSSASACLSAASNLPCRDSSGSVAWILFLVPVECCSWSQDLAAHRQELQLQGLWAWPPGTWRSIRSLLFQSISYFERCFQTASSQQPLHSVSTKVASPPMGTITAREAATSKESSSHLPTLKASQLVGIRQGMLSNLSILWDPKKSSQTANRFHHAPPCLELTWC